MAHYHLINEVKSSLGVPAGDEHFHTLEDGSKTSNNPDSPGHTHTADDGSISGPPVNVGKEAFNDIQLTVSEMFGHDPEDIYLTAFEDKDPSAKVRTRGRVVFDAGDADVTDDKDHFPINTIEQARNALARATQSDFSWYKPGKEAGVAKIKREVKKAYPSIEVSK